MLQEGANLLAGLLQLAAHNELIQDQVHLCMAASSMHTNFLKAAQLLNSRLRACASCLGVSYPEPLIPLDARSASLSPLRGGKFYDLGRS